MKILFVTHRIPYPPNKGDKLRAFNMLKHLGKKNEVYLVSLYDDKGDGKYLSELSRLCKEAHIFYISPIVGKLKGLLSLLSNKPASLGYFRSSGMEKKINEILGTGEFDSVLAYSSTTAQYLMKAKPEKVMDFVDCDSAKWKQYSELTRFPMALVYAIEYRLLRRYEKEVIDNFDRFIVTTESEKREFAKFADTSGFTVMQNGVDAGFFKPAGPADSNRLVFTGAMDYYANVDAVVYFCREIFPLVRKECPDAEFYIVGSKPTALVRSLGAIEGVHVTGFVDDVRSYIGSSSVCVAPMRIAQGIQNKLLEAMASGLPVVTTSKAAASIDALPGRDLFTADTPEDFAEKIIMLLRDRALRIRAGNDARKRIEESYDWEKNLVKLDGILQPLNGNRKKR